MCIRDSNRLIPVEQHLSVCLLHSLGGLIVSLGIIVALEIRTVIHMGAVLAVGVALYLSLIHIFLMMLPSTTTTTSSLCFSMLESWMNLSFVL